MNLTLAARGKQYVEQGDGGVRRTFRTQPDTHTPGERNRDRTETDRNRNRERQTETARKIKREREPNREPEGESEGANQQPQRGSRTRLYR